MKKYMTIKEQKANSADAEMMKKLRMDLVNAENVFLDCEFGSVAIPKSEAIYIVERFNVEQSEGKTRVMWELSCGAFTLKIVIR